MLYFSNESILKVVWANNDLFNQFTVGKYIIAEGNYAGDKVVKIKAVSTDSLIRTQNRIVGYNGTYIYTHNNKCSLMLHYKYSSA